MSAEEILVTAEEIAGAWPAYASLPAIEQDSLLNTACQAVIDHCERTFLKGSVTEYYDGGSRSIWLRKRPVIAVDSIALNGEGVDNTGDPAWLFNGRTGQLTLTATWFPAGTQNVLVSYWGGFDEVPWPVQRATIIMAKYLGERVQTSGIYASERIGEYSYTLNSISTKPTLPDAALDLLTHYIARDPIY